MSEHTKTEHAPDGSDSPPCSAQEIFCPFCERPMRKHLLPDQEEMNHWVGCDFCFKGGVGTSYEGAVQMLLHFSQNRELSDTPGVPYQGDPKNGSTDSQ